MAPRSPLRHVLSLAGLFALLLTSLWPIEAAPATSQATPSAKSLPTPTTTEASAKPLIFEPNRGQLNSDITFKVNAFGGQVGFNTTGLILSLPPQLDEPTAQAVRRLARQHTARHPLDRRRLGQGNVASPPPAVVQQQFIGASQDVKIIGTDRLSGTVSYILGADPAQWYNDIPTYAGLRYIELYPGVSLQYIDDEGMLKSTFTLVAGVDPAQIRWHYTGVTVVRRDPQSGELLLRVPATGQGAVAATLRESTPIAWQERGGQRTSVSVQYVVYPDKSVGFALGAYDHMQPLVIDPIMGYTQWEELGGQSRTEDVTVDGAGNVYTVSTLDTAWDGNYDPQISVTRCDPDGTCDSITINASYEDYAAGIAVDAQGRIIIAGWTTLTGVRNAGIGLAKSAPQWQDEGG